LNVHQKLDPIRNLQSAIPFGVRDMLEQKIRRDPRHHVGDAQTPNDKSGTLFAQVTPSACT